MKTKKSSRKGAQIVIRIEEKDRLELEKEAAADGRNLADYARRVLLGEHVRPKR